MVTGVLVACGSSKSGGPKPLSTFCDNAKASLTKCTENADPCDQTLTTSCTNLANGVSPTTAAAVNDCLESGVCGATTCLTRAQNAAHATAAETALATKYCQLCEPNNGGCQSQFYDPKSKEPGVLVLPYADAIANAIGSQCLADASGCGTFAACTQTTIASALPTLVPPDLATCISGAFQNDTSTTTPTVDGGGAVLQTCTADNCQGCCRNDVCQDGSAVSACGINGNQCSTCGKNQQCLATGECHEPCGPDNCKGCCDGDNCIPGTTDDKCAMNGAACTSCKTTNPDFVCDLGTCVDGSCKATCLTGCCTAQGCQDGTAANLCGTGGGACVDCGYGRTCDGTHACQLDTTSLWDFQAVSAQIPATKADGTSWDLFGGLPDPYLKAYASMGTSSVNGQTSVQTDTLTPAWGDTVLSGISAQEMMNNLSIEVWDQDELDPDDLIGNCRIGLSAAAFNGSLQQVTCTASASTVAVTVLFRLNAHH